MAKILSGFSWVQKFPNSTSLEDLDATFKANAKKFIAALQKAGAAVSIAATKRPAERAYLMHWSFKISGTTDPEAATAMAGVDIEWVHRNAKGEKDLAASRTSANMMVNGYDIAYEPALVSRHSEGKAIDMNISWTAKELTIADAAGKDVVIKTGSKNGSNAELQKVGKSYGVIKLVSDPPHWSTDGH